ncbi:hypothetical protein [Streptomyces cellostaticus]|uniref:hypothetical protein n=1 Tax=Streptomyces cellostaticus TaxID=67285 RepID=UPI00202713DF|nr:hypothetical protein [Streptomyces cellostaticus]
MTTAQSDPEADRETSDHRVRAAPEVKAAWIGVVTAIISAAGAFMAGWLQYSGPGSESHDGASASVRSTAPPPALIVSPTQGDKVDQCTAVRGVTPRLQKDESYWLVVRGADAWSTYYLSRHIEPSTLAESSSADAYGKWDVQAVVGGNKKDAGADYKLILVRTNTLTDEFTSRLANKAWDLGNRLPQGSFQVDSVQVHRTAKECQG